MRTLLRYLFSVVAFASILFILQYCVTNKDSNLSNKVKIDTLSFFDKARSRVVPLAFYYLKNKKFDKQKVIFMNHGYGGNQGGDYLKYSYLTENLARNGYFVVSIQHELQSDDLLAMDGNLQITRLPNWQRGADNIKYVLNEIQSLKPELDYKNLILIGHSNGGDMANLFTEQNPGIVSKLISMDNRRYALPRSLKTEVYTIRSNDYAADPGVLPTAEEVKQFGIAVKFIPVNHSNMDDDANFAERNLINTLIMKFIKEKIN